MQNRISEIEIIPIKPQGGLVGFASFVFDNCFYLSSIGIMTRPQGGYRLTYPIRKNSNNNLNFFYPINKEVAKQIEEAVITKFEDVTSMH
jgi:DNA-binding cell septation regulator SpoVG